MHVCWPASNLKNIHCDPIPRVRFCAGCQGDDSARSQCPPCMIRVEGAWVTVSSLRRASPSRRRNHRPIHQGVERGEFVHQIQRIV